MIRNTGKIGQRFVIFLVIGMLKIIFEEGTRRILHSVLKNRPRRGYIQTCGARPLEAYSGEEDWY
jgi:hypothetical protein